jgi:N-acylneuraminate cytidylyltransferase
VRVIAAIFARGGSKGVPRKNVKMLAGRPLVGWSIEAARAVSRVSRVVVSTDDPEIAEVARACGAEVPFMRPAALATDAASEWLAWQHLIAHVGGGFGGDDDTMLSVPTTSPLRDVADLDACLDALERAQADVAITVTPASRHPAFNMVTRDEDGWAALGMRLDPPVVRRQDAPAMFDITTVAYAARASFIRRAGGVFEGRVATAVVPVERAIDIDTEHDWAIAECLMARKAGAR